jgi:hypothetical protein
MKSCRNSAVVIFSLLIAFFGVMDLVRSLEVILGHEAAHFEFVTDVLGTGHPEENESEKESKTGEENEAKDSKKKKALDVDECDAISLEKARSLRLKSCHRLGNSSSILAIASARIWEPPEWV